MKRFLAVLVVALTGCGVPSDAETKDDVTYLWKKIGKDLYEAKIPDKPIWCYSQNQDVYQSAISCVRH